MSDHRRTLGVQGEAAAAAWYRHGGYEVVASNWRCRDGELDLVLQRDRLLVVCEVKTRSSNAFGGGAEAVDWRKQMRVRRLGARFLSEHDLRPAGVRFDVAVVMPSAHGFAVEVIEAAF